MTSTALNETEKSALRAASEAFLLIRMLASRPMSGEAQQIIRDMADAFHNVPVHCAGSVEQRQANAFLIEDAIRDAIRAQNKYGLVSSHLPTQV
ncbi:hypothetical protein GCM10027277_57570 [Pseudoduganella ginsengisoli]|uniref:Uncharacterized protein n=1 Tax=Pseudoduganella ginsengisoli TaxID=1462440 RepID=A0A6L6Q8U2_9BURK|nr:hypothetical protein [Pseudoduganella ginsengisoli]MTW05879.1 hypothetical protein [Pseudoduganella ginsengisoli]